MKLFLNSIKRINNGISELTKTRALIAQVVKLSDEQGSLLHQCYGARRFVYNHFLDKYSKHLESNKEKIENFKILKSERVLSKDEKKVFSDCYLSYYVQQNQIPELKKLEETKWLKALPSQTVQGYVRDLHNALDRWKKGQNRFPVFKKKAKSRLSARFISANQFNIRRFGKKRFGICLPKVGELHVRSHLSVIAKKSIKVNEVTAFFDRAKGKHFLSINYSFQAPESKKVNSTAAPNSPIGIDRGVHTTAFLSTGEAFNFDIKRLQKRRKGLQRKASRQYEHWKMRLKAKGSNELRPSRKNFEKTQRRISKLHAKESNIRKDFHHKLSHLIVKNHDHVSMEALGVKRMSKSAKGTKEEPGKNVKAKSGLNREILSRGWGMLRQYLQYKCGESFVPFVEVDPKNTSLACLACGHVDKLSRSDQRFRCVSCGYSTHADFLGSVNIMARGLRATGFGEYCIGRFVEGATIRFSDRQAA